VTDPATSSWPVPDPDEATPLFFAVIHPEKEQEVPDTANHPQDLRSALAAVIDPARPAAASGAEVADTILDQFDIRPKGEVDPQEPGAVTGYRPQTAQAVDVVNSSKAFENDLGRWLKQMASDLPTDQLDPRWLSIARTHFQQGFMALNRAVFRPESEL
jgi:hypothetical protein